METQQVIPELYPSYNCGKCDEDCQPHVTAQCSNCDNCESCCECKRCEDCGSLNSPDTHCNGCDNCESCCSCWFCEHCGETHDTDTAQCSNCERCDDTCQCWTCDGCRSGRDRHSNDDYQCERCNGCENHCDCSSCESCGDRCESTCSSCDRCESCCRGCNGDNSAFLRDGELVFHTAKKHQHRVNVSRRHISLELEIATSDRDYASDVTSAAENWDDPIVEDGSLPDSGYEINTNPSSGDVFIDHVNELCGALRDASATVDRSCGMHCHVSAVDYSYFDLFKLCRLYTFIEGGMFDCVSASRRNGNRYAKRCADAYKFRHYTTFKKDIITALYTDDALRLRTQYDSPKKAVPSTRQHRGKKRLTPMAEKYGTERYNALNLHSFFYRGTVEFRHHQGTTDAAKATNWGMLCAAVLDAAHRMTLTEIDALQTLPNSFDRLLAVLPESLKVWARSRRSHFGY